MSSRLTKISRQTIKFPELSLNVELYIGCCGFCRARKVYFENFNAVEIQQTFYRLIKPELAEKWHAEAPQDFVFTIKAFQGITHSRKSPTWRRSNINIAEIKEEVGNLELNKVTLSFWEKTCEISEILKARAILVQLPFSFKQNEENERRIYRFFSEVDRCAEIALELRGWEPSKIRQICEDLSLVDVFDPLQRSSATPDKLYIRLHGKIEGRRINYKYKYTKQELEKIASYIAQERPKLVFVFFNNVYMFDNALEFRQLLRGPVQ